MRGSYFARFFHGVAYTLCLFVVEHVTYRYVWYLYCCEFSLAAFTLISPVVTLVSSGRTSLVHFALLGSFDGTIFILSPVPLVISETRTA